MLDWTAAEHTPESAEQARPAPLTLQKINWTLEQIGMPSAEQMGTAAEVEQSTRPGDVTADVGGPSAGTAVIDDASQEMLADAGLTKNAPHDGDAGRKPGAATALD